MSEPARVVYRDEALLVIDKPSGLLVHRGWANDRDTALSRARALAGQWVYPVHRLDRATSGLLVFALNEDVQRTLSQAFAEGAVHKRYVLLVRGEPADSGLIDHPLPRGEGDGERVPAQTRFVKLGRSPIERCSLIEAEPLTGRTHQLRRHFKHISHPLVGDVRYGKGDVNRLFRERYSFARLALHALRLSLPHPLEGRRLELHAPPPEELRTLLARLELPADGA